MKTPKSIFTFLSRALMVGIFITGNFQNAYSQVQGCTDPLAANFDALAIINNGTCIYNLTSYTPLLKTDPLKDSLIETSGLQWAGNSLWTFNDGGGAAAIYRIDTISNAIIQRVYLQGAVNIDWEDIAFDGLYFYIGDFGNNASGNRTDLKIYKFPFTAIPDYATNPVVTIPAGEISSIHFTYSDQPQPPQVTAANSTNFDCEAMIVDAGKIHLFTKRWLDLTSTHYIIDSVLPGTYVANATETLATNYLVTAADKAPGQQLIGLLGYQNSGTANHFMHLLSDYNGLNYFSGNKRRIDLPNVLVMGQAEGLCFRNGHYGYISNEKFVYSIFNITPKLKAFDIGSFVSGLKETFIFSGDGNWDNIANWADNKMPVALLGAGKQIIIDPLPGKECILNIPYSLSNGSDLIVNMGKSFIVQGNLTLE